MTSAGIARGMRKILRINPLKKNVLYTSSAKIRPADNSRGVPIKVNNVEFNNARRNWISLKRVVNGFRDGKSDGIAGLDRLNAARYTKTTIRNPKR